MIVWDRDCTVFCFLRIALNPAVWGGVGGKVGLVFTTSSQAAPVSSLEVKGLGFRV
jgi:hypothetical protein